MENIQKKKAYERYQHIVDILTEIGDKKGLKLLKELVTKCMNYVKVTIAMESTIKILEFRGASKEEMQEIIVNFDRNKMLAHNALISQLIIVNRYLFRNELIKDKVPVGGIYSGDPDILQNTYSKNSRGFIGDWAQDLIEALSSRGLITT